MHLDHLAGDLRLDAHGGERLHGPDDTDLERNVLAQGLGGEDGHRGRCRRALRAGGAVTAAGRDTDEGERGEQDENASHRSAISTDASTSASSPRTTLARSSADIRASTASRPRSRIACSSSTSAPPARVTSST